MAFGLSGDGFEDDPARVAAESDSTLRDSIIGID